MNNRKPASPKSTPKKTVAKPAAKKAAAKAPVKKAVAKAPAKKAVAKTSAKKTITKPAAKKVVAKAAPKKAIVKAAPKKSAVKKVTQKVVAAKPVVKKVAKKVTKTLAKAAPSKGVRFVAKEKARKVISARPVVKKAAPAAATSEILLHIPPQAEVITAMHPDSLPESVNAAARVLFRLRAEKVQLLDLRGHSDIADYFLLGTCGSEAQMQAILNNLQRDFKSAHLDNLGIEYRAGVRWAVFDGIDVMVHLFEEGARGEYSLERLWRDGKQIDLSPDAYLDTKTGEASDDELV